MYSGGSKDSIKSRFSSLENRENSRQMWSPLTQISFTFSGQKQFNGTTEKLITESIARRENSSFLFSNVCIYGNREMHASRFSYPMTLKKLWLKFPFPDEKRSLLAGAASSFVILKNKSLSLRFSPAASRTTTNRWWGMKLKTTIVTAIDRTTNCARLVFRHRLPSRFIDDAPPKPQSPRN